MMHQKELEEAKKRLIETYRPLEIYLFGSYAWGTPDEESDLDLLIVIDSYDKSRHQMRVEGYKALINIKIPKEILLYSKQEFETYSKDVTRLCHKVKLKGKRIYAKA